MLDMVYIFGPALVAIVFAAFAVTTDPKKHSILRNLFFLATLTSLLLVVNMSVKAAESGDYVVDTTAFNAETNVTSYTYTQVAPSFNSADLTNLYLVVSTVIWLVFAYVILVMWLNILDGITETMDKVRTRKWGYDPKEK